MAAEVDHVSDSVASMGRDWAMLEALEGGTTSMRSAGKLYLPQLGAEDNDAYAARLQRATLMPAYSRTVSVMAGKPFSAELTLSKDTPTEIMRWAEDIDLEGVNLHVFASEQFRESFYGIAGILVESPRPVATGRPASVAEQARAGVRPYWVRVQHRQILGGRIRLQNGRRTLAMLRLREIDTVEDGAWGEAEVERVRVLTPGAWEVWEKMDGKWGLIDQGASGLPVIPFVPLYGKRRSFMFGLPTLSELGHLNVEHWESRSDQQTILKFARVPILFGRLLGQAPITIGGTSAIMATEEKSTLEWVEHSGAAIEAGAKDIAALEERMIQTGAELLVAKPGGGSRTATEDTNDAEGNKCDLLRQTESYEDALNQALWLTAQLASLPTGGSATLFKDFGSANLGTASGQLIKDLMVAGKLSLPSGLIELKRRGELRPELNPEAEAVAVEEEGAALAAMAEADPMDEAA